MDSHHSPTQTPPVALYHPQGKVQGLCCGLSSCNDQPPGNSGCIQCHASPWPLLTPASWAASTLHPSLRRARTVLPPLPSSSLSECPAGSMSSEPSEPRLSLCRDCRCNYVLHSRCLGQRVSSERLLGTMSIRSPLDPPPPELSLHRGGC